MARVLRSADAWQRLAVVACIVASAIALGLAPALMPGDYSWLTHGTSESAAQGVSGVWLARLGFVLWGLAVLWLASRSARRWGRAATALHLVFGVAMTSAAAFSTRSWRAGADFDATEDLLHSIAANVIGFAFALGVLALIIRQLRAQVPPRRFDLVAVGAAALLPIGMSIWGDVDGVLQRLMFVVAYVWYALEAWTAPPRGGSAVAAEDATRP
jgi:hypothetical protein